MRATRIALGAMYFGTRVDEETSLALLDRYVERGGGWIDTANCYAFWAHPSGVGGQSESLIGRWLAARSGVRERVRISTKVRQQPTVPGRWPESAEGLAPATIERAVQESLDRLQTDRLDLYWAHADDRSVPLGEIVDAFGKLAADGTVGRLGASNVATWRIERARRLAAERGVEGFTAMQLRHSYLAPRPGASLDAGHMLASDETLDYARTEGLDLWVYTPLLNGAYVRPDRPLPEAYEHPGTSRRLAALAEVTRETGATANQVVLAWLTGGDVPMRPIVGVSTVAQLDEALDAATLQLTGDQHRRLDEPR